MKTQKLIFIRQVQHGKNKFWLKFYAFSSFDSNKTYIIDYCGTDVESTIPLTEEDASKLLEYLRQDFGYSPFDFEKAIAVIGNGKTYTF